MPTLDESPRTPAGITRKGHVFALISAVFAAFARLVGLHCRHRHVTLPYNRRQVCLECGAARLYVFSSDYEHAQAGIVTGRWRKPQRESYLPTRAVLVEDCHECGAPLAPTGNCYNLCGMADKLLEAAGQ